MADKELVDYFIRQTNQEFNEINRKLDELTHWRWRTEGIQFAISAVISGVVSILVIIFGGN